MWPARVLWDARTISGVGRRNSTGGESCLSMAGDATHVCSQRRHRFRCRLRRISSRGKGMAYRFRALAGVIVVSVLAVYFLPVLMRHDVYSYDAAQHISWMYRFSDPSLFPNCEMRDYFTSNFAPLGFRWLYSVLARIIDPKVASELLPFPLAILTVIGAY